MENERSPLNLVTHYVETIEQIENEIGYNEEKIKNGKQQLRDIRLNQLPEAMQNAGIEKYHHTDGRTIILDQEVHSNISKANRAQAFGWLIGQGYGDVLQYEFTFKVPRSVKPKINLLRELLGSISNTIGLDVKFEEKVNYSGASLIALIKKLRKEGREVPEEIGTFDPLVAKWEKVEAVELE